MEENVAGFFRMALLGGRINRFDDLARNRVDKSFKFFTLINMEILFFFIEY